MTNGTIEAAKILATGTPPGYCARHRNGVLSRTINFYRLALVWNHIELTTEQI